MVWRYRIFFDLLSNASRIPGRLNPPGHSIAAKGGSGQGGTDGMRRVVPAPFPRLLRIPLRAQPADAALAVHPVVGVGLARQARDQTGLGARVIRLDAPVVLGVSDDFEGHFCCCHAALCRVLQQKRTRLVQSARRISGRTAFAREVYAGPAACHTGTRPCRCMTSFTLAMSGGPPAFTTAA